MHMFESNINKDNYVIVNIWTSEDNKAIPGSNVGHVSLQTKNDYISLWPGRRVNKNRELTLIEKYYLKYFDERPISFKPNYEEDCALEALSEDRGRIIENINECQAGEVPYLVNMATGKASILREQPNTNELDKNCYIMAIKPIPANVRVVVYRLRVDQIEAEFKKTDPKSWRLSGSNLVSRAIEDKASENCASFAYRLLKAGGLYYKLDGQTLSNESIYITPNDLVRHIILYKEKELKTFPETTKLFRTGCVDESDVAALRKAYIDNKVKIESNFSNIFGKS